MSDPTLAPEDALRQVADALKPALKALTAADKALKAVRQPAEAPVPARAAVALAAEAVQAAADLNDEATAQALEQARTVLTEATRTWRMGLLKSLEAEATAAGLAFKRLTTEEMRLGEATVLLKLDKGQAQICYAREVLATVEARPASIVREVRACLAALEKAAPKTSAEVHAQLTDAYRAILGRHSLSFGERVHLVDLLPELFIARQSAAFWKSGGAKGATPVTRAQLAWDLDHLQRSRGLEQDGLRITLGTATAGSASKKQQVLFLESGPAGGQYFLTFALRKVSPSDG